MKNVTLYKNVTKCIDRLKYFVLKCNYVRRMKNESTKRTDFTQLENREGVFN